MSEICRTKIIHGFYRYTDIWFEWYGVRTWAFRCTIINLVWFRRNKVLPNKADGYAVKAILAHDALVHPDHPLRIAGKPGIELSIGEVSRYVGSVRHNKKTNHLSFKVLWRMVKRACCSPLPRSNTSATGCTQWATQRNSFRFHIPTVSSRLRGYKITRPSSTKRAANFETPSRYIIFNLISHQHPAHRPG
jgi:hypothetical protein